MQLCSALILFMILSTACGLQCYTCVSADYHACYRMTTCPPNLDQCFSTKVEGFMNKGCRKTTNCVKPVSCCDTDLCNAAVPTGPRAVLLLVSSAISSLFF
nr:PREDICTED: prostate stem cell antigen-like [Paralichthys olivaceus]